MRVAAKHMKSPTVTKNFRFSCTIVVYCIIIVLFINDNVYRFIQAHNKIILTIKWPNNCFLMIAFWTPKFSLWEKVGKSSITYNARQCVHTPYILTIMNWLICPWGIIIFKLHFRVESNNQRLPNSKTKMSFVSVANCLNLYKRKEGLWSILICLLSLFKGQENLKAFCAQNAEKRYFYQYISLYLFNIIMMKIRQYNPYHIPFLL